MPKKRNNPNIPKPGPPQLPQKQPQNLVRTETVAENRFSGLLPPPDVLKGYGELYSDAPNDLRAFSNSR